VITQWQNGAAALVQSSQQCLGGNHLYAHVFVHLLTCVGVELASLCRSHL
jgi:hypothetical protein